MIAFPNAKLNLGLYVTGKRKDGFHNIKSLFLPIDLKDAVEVIPADKAKLVVHGIEIPGDKKDNLCWKAYQYLAEDFDLPPVEIHLLKKIPMGAGLGGGSADAAFTLKLLNEQFELSLTHKELEHYAARLGSDCIFFIENSCAYVKGRGEKVEPCLLDLSGYQVCVIYPKVHMSTAEAFKRVKFSKPPVKLQELTTNQFLTNPYSLSNGFEDSFLQLYPETESIKKELTAQGALYASLTGSGSSYYGIFEPSKKDFATLSQFAERNDYRFISTIIL